VADEQQQQFDGLARDVQRLALFVEDVFARVELEAVELVRMGSGLLHVLNEPRG
jgi:hypothetical protein